VNLSDDAQRHDEQLLLMKSALGQAFENRLTTMSISSHLNTKLPIP
jgi:hypothetical protein